MNGQPHHLQRALELSLVVAIGIAVHDDSGQVTLQNP